MKNGSDYRPAALAALPLQDVPVPSPASGVLDNCCRGTVADVLRSRVRHGSRLSV